MRYGHTRAANRGTDGAVTRPGWPGRHRSHRTRHPTGAARRKIPAVSSEEDDMDNIISDGRDRPRRAQAAILAAALAGIAVLAAACAGGSPIGAGSGSGQTPYQQALAYAQCMRAHGDPGFPDPNSQGLFPHPAGSQYQAASRACGHLLPSQPLTAAQKQEHVRQALQFASCMRSHGYPNYPDPIVRNGGAAVGLGFGGIDQSSPQFQAAVQTCRKFEPGLVAQLAGGRTP